MEKGADKQQDQDEATSTQQPAVQPVAEARQPSSSASTGRPAEGMKCSELDELFKDLEARCRFIDLTEASAPAPSACSSATLQDANCIELLAASSETKGTQPAVPLQSASHASSSKEDGADQSRQERMAVAPKQPVQHVPEARKQPLEAASDHSAEPRAQNGSGDDDSISDSEAEGGDSLPPAHLSSAALTRYTQRPSPVFIPPNSIGLAYLHSFLSAAECAQLIDLSEGRFYRSRTFAGIVPGRTSHSAIPSRSHPAVQAVRARVAGLTGARNAQIETIRVVRYEPGQQFLPHYDSSRARTSPRSHTILAYLNDEEAGGSETEFTKLGIKFQPKRGDALFWETESRTTRTASTRAGRLAAASSTVSGSSRPTARADGRLRTQGSAVASLPTLTC
jgi:prolyl 4-hydroxylase